MSKPVEMKARPRERRGSAHERGYTSAWTKARKAYLLTHRFCVMCEAQGKIRLATVVDHIVPHKGDMVLFWDSANNWQPLCKPHHDRDKQRIENGRPPQTLDAEGWPV